MNKEIVIAICISKEKQLPKERKEEAFLIKDFGIEGDSHAGTKRQVSMLAQEDADKFTKETGILAPAGCFAENIRTKGLRLKELPVGTRLSLGETIVEITEIGKPKQEAHTYSYKGYSLLPSCGVFAKIIKGGRLKEKDPIRIIKERS